MVNSMVYAIMQKKNMASGVFEYGLLGIFWARFEKLPCGS